MRDVKQNIPDIREIGLFYALLIVKQLAASEINEYLMQIESVTKAGWKWLHKRTSTTRFI